MHPKKIAVGMSGGVDSSMSLLLLKRQGWEPVGVSLQMHAFGDIEPAKQVCEKLGVPHHVYDVQKDFERCVIDFLASELRAGRTPNPCAECNRTLKFVKLFEWAQAHGIDYVATGHYARSTPAGELLRPKDLSKDQTYGLCFLTGEQLSHTIFPLGELTKKEVLSLAKKEGFEIFETRKQSQDLCFVSGKDLPKFIEEKVGKKPGPIFDSKGKRLGFHKGLHFYTIGQRKRLGLNGLYFVKSLDHAKNTLIVTTDRSEILQQEAHLSNLHFISGKLPTSDIPVLAQARYRQPPVEATLHPLGNGKALISFSSPIEAVTPGQVCALYTGGLCLGGGIIIRATF